MVVTNVFRGGVDDIEEIVYVVRNVDAGLIRGDAEGLVKGGYWN